MTYLLCIGLVFSLLASATQAELSFRSEDDQYNYRSLTVNPWSIAGLWTGVYYHSVEVDVDTKQPKADGNYIWGSIYVGLLSYPINWQGYFSASVSANRSIHNPDGIDWASFDVAWTSSFVASAYVRLIEKNSTGHPVTLQDLDKVWKYDVAQSQSLTNKTAGLYAAVFSAILPNKAVVTITYINTEQSGVLDVLDGVRVVPKGIETIVGIDGWPYEHEENTLSLVVAVGSRDVAGNINGQLVSTGTDEEDATFFRASKKVSVAGKIEDVKSINIDISNDIEGNFGKFSGGLSGQLRSKYNKEATCGVFAIEFPAGATEIIYDPSMGSGPDPFDDEGSKVGLIVGVTLGCVFAVVLLLGVVWYFHGKRAEYQQVG